MPEGLYCTEMVVGTGIGPRNVLVIDLTIWSEKHPPTPITSSVLPNEHKHQQEQTVQDEVRYKA